jgi:hypothetical protein
LILRPARGTDPTVDIGVATQSYEQFRLTREDAAAIVSDVRAGLAHLPEMLDQWGVVAADRELLAQVMPQVDLRKTMIPALNTTMTVDTAPRQSSETWTDNNKMGRPPRSALEYLGRADAASEEIAHAAAKGDQAEWRKWALVQRDLARGAQTAGLIEKIESLNAAAARRANQLANMTDAEIAERALNLEAAAD